MKLFEKKGISLIVLIITIVVMVIIAGVIILNLSDDELIGNSEEAVQKSDMSNFKEAVQTEYGSWQLAVNMNKTNKGALEFIEDKLSGSYSAEWFEMLELKPEGGVAINNVKFSITTNDGTTDVKTDYATEENKTWADFVKKVTGYSIDDDGYVVFTDSASYFVYNKEASTTKLLGTDVIVNGAAYIHSITAST